MIYIDKINNIKKLESIYFIGCTGSGKSTLVNCLLQNPIETIPLLKDKEGRQVDSDFDTSEDEDTEEQSEKSTKKIFNFDNNISKRFKIVERYQHLGPKIGESEVESETRYPSLYNDINNNLNYVDCPGFLDTNGFTTNVLMGLSIKKSIISSKKIKALVAIISIPDLYSTKSNSFKNVIRSISKILNDPHKFLESIRFIFTKGTIQNIKEYFVPEIYSLYKNLYIPKTDQNINIHLTNTRYLEKYSEMKFTFDILAHIFDLSKITEKIKNNKIIKEETFKEYLLKKIPKEVLLLSNPLNCEKQRKKIINSLKKSKPIEKLNFKFVGFNLYAISLINNHLMKFIPPILDINIILEEKILDNETILIEIERIKTEIESNNKNINLLKKNKSFQQKILKTELALLNKKKERLCERYNRFHNHLQTTSNKIKRIINSIKDHDTDEPIKYFEEKTQNINSRDINKSFFEEIIYTGLPFVKEDVNCEGIVKYKIKLKDALRGKLHVVFSGDQNIRTTELTTNDWMNMKDRSLENISKEGLANKTLGTLGLMITPVAYPIGAFFNIINSYRDHSGYGVVKIFVEKKILEKNKIVTLLKEKKKLVTLTKILNKKLKNCTDKKEELEEKIYEVNLYLKQSYLKKLDISRLNKNLFEKEKKLRNKLVTLNSSLRNHKINIKKLTWMQFDQFFLLCYVINIAKLLPPYDSQNINDNSLDYIERAFILYDKLTNNNPIYKSINRYLHGS